MRQIRRLCAAFVLTFMLALSALAGDMTTGIVAPAPPPQQTAAAAGDMTTGYAGEMSTTSSATTTGSTMQAALSLVQSMLSLI
jgi:hypothetical protein